MGKLLTRLKIKNLHLKKKNPKMDDPKIKEINLYEISLNRRGFYETFYGRQLEKLRT